MLIVFKLESPGKFSHTACKPFASNGGRVEVRQIGCFDIERTCSRRNGLNLRPTQPTPELYRFTQHAVRLGVR